MAEPVWVEREALVVLHDRSLATHGGAEGIRDSGLLDSALMRLQNRYHYEGVADLAELAATYAIAVASNHPFVDGNKRAAFQCLSMFLRLNGSRLKARQADAALTMLAVAAGKVDQQMLAAWVRANV